MLIENVEVISIFFELIQFKKKGIITRNYKTKSDIIFLKIVVKIEIIVKLVFN